MRRIPLPSRAMAVALLALFVALGGTALAANPSLFLNQANTATAPTSLTANVAGKTLQLTNASTAASATPLGLTPGAGRPPFQTPSTTKVAHLNSDLLDGIDSTGFVRAPSIYSNAVSMVPGTTPFTAPNALPGLASISFSCAAASAQPRVVITNQSQFIENLFVTDTSGAVGDQYVQLQPGDQAPDVGDPTPGNQVTFSLQGTPNNIQTVGIVHVGLVYRQSTNECHFQIQATTTSAAT